MVRRICPVCDQVMESKHYCSTCRRWVRTPWVHEVGYYLNERQPQNGKGYPNQPRSDTARPNTGNYNQPGIGPRRNKNQNINLAIVVVIAIYLTVTLLGAGLFGRLKLGFFGHPRYDITFEDSGGAEEEAVYHELEDAAVAAAGEACNSRGHFDIQGREILSELEGILENLGYGLGNCYKQSRNEIYDDGSKCFDTVVTMELARGGNSAYQYIDINYDTATGDLHEVDIVMADGADAVDAAVSVLEYLEAAGAVPPDQACSGTASGELGNAVLYGENVYYVFGNVEIDVYCHSDCYGIYIFRTPD